jgi:hypothetical protein
MKNKIEKKILFVGPSAMALENFDYSLFNNYDYIARTNTFMANIDIEDDKNRCDYLFVNNFANKYYIRKKLYNSERFSKIQKMFVKSTKQQKKIITEYKNIDVGNLNKTIKYVKKYIPKRVVYLGTIAITFLSLNFKEVDVCGMDFYRSGFGINTKYISNYIGNYSYKRHEEEPGHNIKQDIKFLLMLTEKQKNINFIHKTKDIWDNINRERIEND